MTAPPPSHPDRRVSRIRLSSQWVLCREGAALRLVPKSVSQTFGITQANCTRLIPPLASPRGHSRWFAFPSFCPSHFHFPTSLRPTVVTRFFATTDALTPAGRFFGLCCHERRLFPAGLPDSCIGASDHSVSNHRCNDWGPPRCPAIRLVAYRPLCRLRLSPEDSPVHTDRIEFTCLCVSRRCYGLALLVPLLSTPHRCDAVTVRYRTALHRTGKDFHRSIPMPSQAHEWGRLVPITFLCGLRALCG